MLTREEALEILRIEKACVVRNEHNACDRDCYNCDLVRPTEKILETYDMAIAAIEKGIVII